MLCYWCVTQGCQLRFLLRFSTWLPPPPISAILLRFLRLEGNVLFIACFHRQRRFRCRTSLRRANPRACFKLVMPATRKGNSDWLLGVARANRSCLFISRKASTNMAALHRKLSAESITFKLLKENIVTTRNFELMSTKEIIQPYIDRRPALICESLLT